MEKADVIYTHLQASAMLNDRKTMRVSHILEPEICSSASLFASHRSTCFTHLSGILHKIGVEFLCRTDEGWLYYYTAMHFEKHIFATEKGGG